MDQRTLRESNAYQPDKIVKTKGSSETLCHIDLIQRIFALEAKIAADEERWSRKILQNRMFYLVKKAMQILIRYRQK